MKNLIVLLALLLTSLPLAAQPIYKIVDEHGNVTYTDQKPSDSAQPLRLPELNIMHGDTAPVAVEPPDAEESGPALNFRILAPQHEAMIFSANNSLDIRLGSDIQIPPTAQIVLYLNEVALAPVRSMEVTLDELERGEYNLRAELQTMSGRVLADTDTVVFFMGEPLR